MAGPKRERFLLFRLSLMERSAPGLFAPAEKREDYLRRVFGQAREFEHYSNRFHYVPREDVDAGNVIMAAIGRAVESDENLPPVDGFAEAKRQTWKASVFVLDPTDHEDGQKIALEIDPKVGSPAALLGSLVANINATTDGQYIIEAGGIPRGETFWAWANQPNRRVTDLTFDVPAPNGIFNTNARLRDELKAARQITGTQTVTLGLHSPEGLKTNVEPIADAVDYAESSGGKIRAKDADGNSFHSTTGQKSTTMPEDGDAPLIARVARQVNRILGR